MKNFTHHYITALVVTVLVASASSPATAQPDDRRTAILSHVEADYPRLEKLYRQLHASPELSFYESATSERLAALLEAEGFTVTRGVGERTITQEVDGVSTVIKTEEHGVVAVMKNGPGPTLLIRADMDGLPIIEETGAAYASQVLTTNELGAQVGIMHACGHDIHMTSLAGAAKALAAMSESWSGTLVMIGQPAEERGSGARAMLADGLFKKFPRPDYAIALHVDAGLEAGKIGYVSGYSFANVDSVDITVKGRGGHGAYPHLTIDPVVVAARIVVALQTIVSREVSATDPAVITVGSIHGGTKHNIIPDEVRLQLTVRSYSDEVRKKLLDGIERTAHGVALAAGVPEALAPVVEFKDEYTPSLYNSPALVERTTKVFQNLLGRSNVIERTAVMGGEDFGLYGRQASRTPIFMFRLGSIPADRLAESLRPGGAPLPSLHSSGYLPEMEPTIKTGVATMTAAALELLSPPEQSSPFN